jgi:3-oxoacyl-(acyl-carrier-protein) synthase
VSPPERRRVVVTGLGVVAPNGLGLSAFRSGLKRGASGITRHEILREMNYACQIGGVPPLTEDDILKVLPYSTYHKLSEAMVYAALAAVECARSSGVKIDLKAGYLESPVDWETGAVIGCGVGGGMDVLMDEYFPILLKAREASPGRGATPVGCDSVPKIMGSGVSVTVGKILGLGGQVSTNSSACTTGTEAVFEAYKSVALGFADSMYAGGAEGSHHGIWAGFDAMRDVLCSTANETPELASRPMSATASGFVPGSGAGMLRLESLETALERGAPVLCEILSAFCNSGGQRDGGTMTFPNPEGVVRCIRRAVADAGISGSDVSLINGHLTSTAADPLEVDNWLRALGLPAEAFPLIQSTKSMVGHGLGAAGAIEAVAVVDQIAQGYVHPSINCEDVHREIRRVERSIPHSGIERRLDHVVKASFGFGDVNGAIVFKRWDGDTSRLTRSSN